MDGGGLHDYHAARFFSFVQEGNGFFNRLH